jgi:hypothetical protein
MEYETPSSFAEARILGGKKLDGVSNSTNEIGTGRNAATLRASSVKISNHLQKVAKDAKAQPLLPAGPTGLQAE